MNIYIFHDENLTGINSQQHTVVGFRPIMPGPRPLVAGQGAGTAALIPLCTGLVLQYCTIYTSTESVVQYCSKTALYCSTAVLE